MLTAKKWHTDFCSHLLYYTISEVVGTIRYIPLMEGPLSTGAIYYTNVHKNKTYYVALNVVNCLCHKLNDTNRPLGRNNQTVTG